MYLLGKRWKRTLPPTEQAGPVDDLHTMSVEALLAAMHRVDDDVQTAVLHAMPALEPLITKLVERMRQGGRLFYLGAGTSGRLGVVDASECPPTFGVAPDRVVGIMAGGDAAIRSAVEGAEDDAEQGWKDLEGHGIQELDTVVGIAASGRTPYVIGALRHARLRGHPDWVRHVQSRKRHRAGLRPSRRGGHGA